MLLRRCFLLLFLAALLPADQDTFENVARIVAVGDVHGDLGQFKSVLQAAGVINARSRWTGGKTHLVQTGDVVDRGADSRKVMDLLMDLEKQVARSGGRVHALIGNHEAMNVYGDLRYVSAGEYESYKTGDAAELRDKAFQHMVKGEGSMGPEFRAKWDAEHPLGWVEHRQAFSAGGRYGEWIRKLNAAVKINDVLFVHGGISPAYVNVKLAGLNERVRAELHDLEKIQTGIVVADDGPLWYRGMAYESEERLTAHVDQTLAAFGVRYVAIAHSPTPGGVIPRFGGKVLLIDVGLSQIYGGTPACLMIENGKFYALHRGTRLDLPMGTSDITAYLRAAIALDPKPSQLERRLAGRPAPATTE